MKEEQEVPKELTEEEIFGYDSQEFRFGADWAKERSDIYWKHILSEQKKESNRILIEEVVKAHNHGISCPMNNINHWGGIDTETIAGLQQEYISQVKEKYNIKD